MEYEDETLRLYVLIQDCPGELTVLEAVKVVRSDQSLVSAGHALFFIITRNLDYRNDLKTASLLRRLVGVSSLRLKLPADFPTQPEGN